MGDEKWRPPVVAHPTALISWSHVDPGWTRKDIDQRRNAVFLFSTVLRENGIDAELDLYHLSDSVDWTRWGPGLVSNSDYVIVVVSEAWKDAWEGRGDPTKGAGAAAETDTLRSLYAKNRDEFLKKVRLVLLPGTSSSEIPDGLHGLPRFPLDSIDDVSVESLLRSLTRQSEYTKVILGRLPFLPEQSARAGQAKPTRGTTVPPSLVVQRLKGSRRNYEKTVAEPIALSALQGAIDAQKFDELVDVHGDLASVWGFNDSYTDVFEQVRTGDIFVFHDATHVFARGRVAVTWVSSEAARRLITSRKWTDEYREVSYELMLSLVDFEPQECRLSELRAIGPRGIPPSRSAGVFPLEAEQARRIERLLELEPRGDN